MNRRTGRDAHPDWCAADHRCRAIATAGEHRSEPQVIRVPGAGSAVLTRVQTVATGVQHAEVRLSITLPGNERAARRRLAALLSHLRLLISEPTPAGWDDTTQLPTAPQRPAQLPPARRRAA